MKTPDIVTTEALLLSQKARNGKVKVNPFRTAVPLLGTNHSNSK